MTSSSQVKLLATEGAEAASSAQEFRGGEKNSLMFFESAGCNVANVVGKAERKEAEVAKLQRTVVNKEGQVGRGQTLLLFIVFVRSK